MYIYKLRIEIKGSTQQFYFNGFPLREDVIKALEGYSPYIKKEGLEVLERIEGWFDCNSNTLQELYIEKDTWGRNVTLDSFYCHQVNSVNPDESFRNYGNSFLLSANT